MTYVKTQNLYKHFTNLYNRIPLLPGCHPFFESYHLHDMARSLFEGASVCQVDRFYPSISCLKKNSRQRLKYTSTAKRITPYTIHIHTSNQPIGEVLTTDCRFNYCICAIAIADWLSARFAHHKLKQYQLALVRYYLKTFHWWITQPHTLLKAVMCSNALCCIRAEVLLASLLCFDASV